MHISKLYFDYLPSLIIALLRNKKKVFGGQSDILLDKIFDNIDAHPKRSQLSRSKCMQKIFCSTKNFVKKSEIFFLKTTRCCSENPPSIWRKKFCAFHYHRPRREKNVMGQGDLTSWKSFGSRLSIKILRPSRQKLSPRRTLSRSCAKRYSANWN